MMYHDRMKGKSPAEVLIQDLEPKLGQMTIDVLLNACYPNGNKVTKYVHTVEELLTRVTIGELRNDCGIGSKRFTDVVVVLADIKFLPEGSNPTFMWKQVHLTLEAAAELSLDHPAKKKTPKSESVLATAGQLESPLYQGHG